MTFFFDRCIALPIARMLGAFELIHNVIHQDEDGRFENDSEDIEIINTLALESPRPVWITADIAQRRVNAERAALRDSGMTIFFCKRNNLTPHLQSLKMLAIWPTVVSRAVNVRVPTAFEIPFGRIGGQINEKIIRICNTSELFAK